jgi:hypothetical protein
MSSLVITYMSPLFIFVMSTAPFTFRCFIQRGVGKTIHHKVNKYKFYLPSTKEVEEQRRKYLVEQATLHRTHFIRKLFYAYDILSFFPLTFAGNMQQSKEH